MSLMEAFGMEEEEDESEGEKVDVEGHETDGGESSKNSAKKPKHEASTDDDEAGGIVRRSKRVPKPTIAIREHFEHQQAIVRHGGVASAMFGAGY